MKKYITITGLVLLLGTASLQAQVGISTNNPNKDAALDLNNTDGSNTKGLLLPKVALTATNSAAPLSAHTAGMKVYNTATAGSGITAVTPGEYYNDGSKWVRSATIANAADANDAWILGGNTNGALKELGTKDNQPLPLRIDNTNAGLISKTATAFGYNALNPASTGISNTAVGLSALTANTTGASNTAVGNLALSMNTTGGTNTALGDKALRSNISGTQNVAIGSGALENNTSGSNVAVGYQALNLNTTGGSTAVGWRALASNTVSPSNTAIGYNALNSLTSGAGNNTAMGYNALGALTNGTANVAIGYNALGSSTSSSVNVAIGNSSMEKITTGGDNVAVGHNTLNANTTGSNNYALGNKALMNNVSGSNNSAIGSNALLNLTSGNENVAVGQNAGAVYGTSSPVTNATNSIFIGNGASPAANSQTNQIVIGYGAKGRGSNTVQIGNTAMTSIGGQVAWSNPSDVRLKKDIHDSDFGLNFISKLRPVTYFMKSGTTDLQSGFIAQEVEATANSINYKFSGIVKPQNDTEFYSLRYAEFVVPLVKAVQEQQKEIEAKDAKILELEERLQKLGKAVDTLLKNK